MLQKLTHRLPWRKQPASPSLPMMARVKAGGVSGADADNLRLLPGAGGGWNRTEYGEYYATSTPVYSAIRIRAEALTRPPVVVYRRAGSESGGLRLPVGPEHPAQQLLERVNRWYTRADLWRATEIYLNLWGSAYWMLDRDADGNREIWPLRPDRVSIVPDKSEFIRGFVYHGRSRMLALTPDEVVWFRYFNPLEEYAGLSPVAPARLAVDMGKDGLRFNRNFLRNSAQPDFVMLGCVDILVMMLVCQMLSCQQNSGTGFSISCVAAPACMSLRKKIASDLSRPFCGLTAPAPNGGCFRPNTGIGTVSINDSPVGLTKASGNRCRAHPCAAGAPPKTGDRLARPWAAAGAGSAPRST